MATTNERALLFLRQLRWVAGTECPGCRSTDIESNGHAEYRCITCDHRWGNDGSGPYGH